MKSTEKRFWEKVIPVTESGCWLWTGWGTNGYGCFYFDGRKVKAHRFSYEYFKGEIPSGLDLDHLCRVRCCVNPDHLEPVTRKENMRRSPLVGKNQNTNKELCVRGHPLKGDNLYLYKNRRICRECARMHARAYEKKRGKRYGTR